MIVGRTKSFVPAIGELNDDQIHTMYGSLLGGAFSAFETDPSYFADMVEHANAIVYKRKLWEIRKEVQAAEREARAQCTLDSKECPFTCTNAGACGFGQCRYASTEFSRIETAPTADGAERPTVATYPRYKLQDTINEVVTVRGIKAPSKTRR